MTDPVVQTIDLYEGDSALVVRECGNIDVIGTRQAELMSAALSALEGQEPVAVKALEWKVVHDCAWFAFDTYRIEDGRDWPHCANWPHDRYWLYVIEKSIGKFDSLDAAKAAAQDDFELRIRSALAPAARERKLVADIPESEKPYHGPFRPTPSEPTERWRSRAADDVLAERRRQVEDEGWTPEHDDRHGEGELARAGVCYALHAVYGDEFGGKEHAPGPWPWDRKWWKPKTRRRDLVRAAALIIAELERLDRLATPEPKQEEEER